MSFILDALRKAETLRGARDTQRMEAPRPVPARGTRGHPGLWLTFALLVGAAGLGAWWLARSPGPPPALEQPAAAAPVAAATPPAAPPLGEPDPAPSAGSRGAVRALAVEPARGTETAAATPGVTRAAPVRPGTVEVRDLLGGGDATPPDSAAPATASSGPGARGGGTVEVRDLLGDEQGTGPPLTDGAATPTAPAPAPAPAPVPTPAPAARSAAAPPDVPTLNQLVGDGTLAPPSLRMDLLVYDTRPEQRSVYINMRRYREGERTAEDALVEQITPQGAVLRYQGRRFLLQPR